MALFYVSKVLQMGGLASWYYYTAPWANMFEISAFQWVTGLQLILFGQLLNFSIYDAIGKNCVYYGNKFEVNSMYWLSFQCIYCASTILRCGSNCIWCHRIACNSSLCKCWNICCWYHSSFVVHVHGIS